MPDIVNYTYDRAALFDLMDVHLTVAANELSRTHLSQAERWRLRGAFRRAVYEAMDDLRELGPGTVTVNSLGYAAYAAAVGLFRAGMIADGSIDADGLPGHKYPNRCFHNQVLSVLLDAVAAAEADFARFIDDMGGSRKLKHWHGRPTALIDAVRDAADEWPR